MEKLEYRLVRTNRKTIAIQITSEATVLVRAPLRASQHEIESMLSKHYNWILNKVAEQRQFRKEHPEPTPEQRQACIEKATELLPRRVEYYANRMGVQPSGISITDAKKRLGSCSAKNRLCFPWRLMLFPEEAIDAVVVHELAHIRYKNHGPDFYRFIESIMPDYRERTKLFKS